MTKQNKIAIVIGSTRQNRIGREVAEWIFGILQDKEAISKNMFFEIVDLAEVNLPFFDEDLSPREMKQGETRKYHTEIWSKIVSGFDAFIFVSPEYNHSFPASLKNALDYLYYEWLNKKCAIVSYGFMGGAEANKILQKLTKDLGMNNLKINPTLTITHEMFNENTTKPRFKNIENYFTLFAEQIFQLKQELQDL
jgi:NAD(P)H-dependent FMN reductase